MGQSFKILFFCMKGKLMTKTYMSQNKLQFFFLNWKSVHDLSCTVKVIACTTHAQFRLCMYFVPACCVTIFLSLTCPHSQMCIRIYRPVSEWCVSHLHVPTHASVYLGMLLPHMQNFIWWVNCTSILQQVCSTSC